MKIRVNNNKKDKMGEVGSQRGFDNKNTDWNIKRRRYRNQMAIKYIGLEKLIGFRGLAARGSRKSFSFHLFLEQLHLFCLPNDSCFSTFRRGYSTLKFPAIGGNLKNVRRT